MARLSDVEIAGGMRNLPGWERSGERIVRTIRFPEFLDGIEFINRVARLAEEADHHPDIDIRYRTVTLALTTHSEGGLTEKDLALAGRIDQVID